MASFFLFRDYRVNRKALYSEHLNLGFQVLMSNSDAKAKQQSPSNGWFLDSPYSTQTFLAEAGTAFVFLRPLIVKFYWERFINFALCIFARAINLDLTVSKNVAGR